LAYGFQIIDSQQRRELREARFFCAEVMEDCRFRKACSALPWLSEGAGGNRLTIGCKIYRHFISRG
jgi:hypothetical protein